MFKMMKQMDSSPDIQYHETLDMDFGHINLAWTDFEPIGSKFTLTPFYLFGIEMR